jgi:SpoIIAA-like
VPLKWTVHRETRLVEVKGTGRLHQRDIADYLSSVIKARAAAYSALFDISAAEVELSSAELTAFSQQVQVRGSARAGAIAIVVSSEAEHELADHFVRRARGGRACRLFADAAQARAWLKMQG